MKNIQNTETDSKEVTIGKIVETLQALTVEEINIIIEAINIMDEE